MNFNSVRENIVERMLECVFYFLGKKWGCTRIKM